MTKTPLWKRLRHGLRLLLRAAWCWLRARKPDWLKTRERLIQERNDARRTERIWHDMASGDDAALRLHFACGAGFAEMKGKIPGLCGITAQARNVLIAQDAVNYVELRMVDDLGELILTIQKREGKTPNERRLEAEAERDALRERIKQLGGAL